MYVHTLLSRLLSNPIRNSRRTPKINAQNLLLNTTSPDQVRNIKIVLSKLIICRCNMFAAKLDAGECIQAVEEEPSLYSARLASKSELMYLVLGFCYLFFLMFFF